MAAKGTKRTKSTKGVQPINTPWWAPTWGGNRTDVPVRGPNVTYFNPPTIPTWTPPANTPPMSPGYGGSWIPAPEAIVPSPSTPVPAATTGTLPPVMPEFPAYGPMPGSNTAQEFAPNLTTGNAGGSGGYGNPDYNYWYNMAQNQEQWTPEEQASYLAQFYGQTDAQGNLTYVGNPRFGDPYQVMPYWKYDQPTWIGGREGGASSMGRGRMPSRYYIPKQEFYKTPGGKTYASRDGWEDAFGKDEKPAGNNNMKTIPAWVGPLVSWRT